MIQLGKMEANLDQDRKVIWGNGKPGLLDKMSDLSQCVTKLSEQMKNQTDKLDQLIQRIDEHKEIQSSVMVRVEKLENEVLTRAREIREMYRRGPLFSDNPPK